MGIRKEWTEKGRGIEMKEEEIGGESENGGPKMENCGGLCERKYKGNIEKIREMGGRKREGSTIDDMRRFQCNRGGRR